MTLQHVLPPSARVSRLRPIHGFLVILAMSAFAVAAHAANVFLNTTIDAVSVTGGSDSVNPGTTYVRVAAPVASACGGWVTILNNNKNLIAAVIAAKTSGSNVWFYYEDSLAPVQYCSGHTYTPCTVVSISLQ